MYEAPVELIPESIRRQFEFMADSLMKGELVVMPMTGVEDKECHYVLAHVFTPRGSDESEVFPIGEIYTPHEAMSRYAPYQDEEE